MAKERPYRCQNEACSEDPAGRLIFDFWSTEAKCPKCGSTPLQHIVIPLEVIHYDPPSNIRGRGQRVMACNRGPYGTGQMVTGAVSAVTCRECKATEEWRTAAEQQGIEPELITPESPLAETIFEVAKQQIEEIASLQAAAVSPAPESPLAEKTAAE